MGASVCCVVVLYVYCSMPLHPRKEKEEGSRGEFLPGIAASIKTIIGVAGLSRSSWSVADAGRRNAENRVVRNACVSLSRNGDFCLRT